MLARSPEPETARVSPRHNATAAVNGQVKSPISGCCHFVIVETRRSQRELAAFSGLRKCALAREGRRREDEAGGGQC